MYSWKTGSWTTTTTTTTTVARVGSTGVVDTVGAGDAFLASLLVSLLHMEQGDAFDELAVQTALDEADALGRYVASHRGATPPHAGAVMGTDCTS